MHTNLNEIPILLCCLWCGLAIGILYDVFRLLRRIRSVIVTAIADLLFGLLAFAMLFAVLLYCDDGRVRLFSLFGVLLGAVLWQRLPGRLIRSCFARVLSWKRKNAKDRTG